MSTAKTVRFLIRNVACTDKESLMFGSPFKVVSWTDIFVGKSKQKSRNIEFTRSREVIHYTTVNMQLINTYSKDCIRLTQIELEQTKKSHVHCVENRLH